MMRLTNCVEVGVQIGFGLITALQRIDLGLADYLLVHLKSVGFFLYNLLVEANGKKPRQPKA